MKLGVYITLVITTLLLVVFFCFFAPVMSKMESNMEVSIEELILEESLVYSGGISGLLTAKYDLIKLLANQVNKNISEENAFADFEDMKKLALSYMESNSNKECMAYWIEYELDSLPVVLREKLSENSSSENKQVLLLAQNWSGKQLLQTILLDATGHEYYKSFQEGYDYHITEPTNYPNLSKDDLVVSLTRPLKHNGRVIGVCGIDVNTRGLKEYIGLLHPLHAGESRLLSGNLLVIADSIDKDKRGVSFVGNEKFEERAEAVARHGHWSGMVTDEETGKTDFITSVAVPIGDSGVYWIFERIVAKSSIEHRIGVIIGPFIAQSVGVLVFSLIIGLVASYIITRAIKDYEEWFSQILNTIGLPVTIFSNSKKVLFANNAAVRLLALDKGDQLGSNEKKYNKLVEEGLLVGIERLGEPSLQHVTTLEFADKRWEISCDYLLDSKKIKKGLVGVVNDQSTVYRQEKILKSVFKVIENLEESNSQVSMTMQELSECASLQIGCLGDLAELLEEFGSYKNSEEAGDGVNYSVLSDKIINKISEIVSQSNLLAVNVNTHSSSGASDTDRITNIAQQVQKLSQRSAEAADEIAQVIDRGNDEIGKGFELADNLYRAIDVIIRDTGKMENIISNIAVASLQQYEEIRQINKELEHVSSESIRAKLKSQQLIDMKKSAATSHKIFSENREISARVTEGEGDKSGELSEKNDCVVK